MEAMAFTVYVPAVIVMGVKLYFRISCWITKVGSFS